MKIEKIECDLSGRDLTGDDAQFATEIWANYKETDTMEDKNHKKMTFVKSLFQYNMHICHHLAPEFMKELGELVAKYKAKHKKED